MFGKFGIWEFAIIIPICVIGYAPIIIASIRRTKHILGIVLLNILGGWTVVGWVIALIWSIRDEKKV